MKKSVKVSILFLIISLSISSLKAQSKIKTYDLKKGEVLDILLISQKTKTDSLFKEYRKIVFPFAFKMTYKPLLGVKINEASQSNYQPETLVLAKWSSVIKRKQFLSEIEILVPDFHQRRKDIWSLFDLTYYEIDKDISFEIDLNKLIVVTAYWKSDDHNKSFEEFTKKWKLLSEGNGADTKIELFNGTSPFGYYYKPDYLVISQWNSRVSFDVFYKENIKMDHKSIKHVNQFIIDSD